MINTTKGQAVFIETGERLNVSIIAALRLASKWMLSAYNFEDLDLGKVNTKSYTEAIFSAYVDEFILPDDGAVFTENYVRDALELVRAQIADCPPALYFRLTMAEGALGKREYRKSYLASLRRGFGAFLVALHLRRAIVLPFTFRWPTGLELGAKGKVLGRREICPLGELPELLGFIRSLDSQSDEQTEVVLNRYSLRSRETLFSLGQRLIIAAGWLTPGDANYEDLLALWDANEKTRFSANERLCFLLLVDLLERKYQSNIPISADGWRIAVTQAMVLRQGAVNDPVTQDMFDDSVVLEYAIGIAPARMAPEELAQMTRLPGLQFDIVVHAKTWLAVERSWLKKVKRESNKGRLTSIGHLNIYLFAYLPYWLAAHPTFPYKFPSSPNGMLGAVFVSDIGVLDIQCKPLTLVDFLAATAANRKWGNATHYAHLKQIEKLFDFIERIGHQMPECGGFRQPLSRHDYPQMAHSYGTNKRPIPRSIYKFWVDYIEAIAAHANVLLNRVVYGEVLDIEVGGLAQSKAVIIDCFEQQDLFGFIPVIFHKGKVLPLRYIPNVLYLDRKHLIDGRVARIPHPHALHQILVALYSGVRHNHIQWLDAETFDMHVDENGQRQYAKLHVNTDKVKTAPWQSYVDFQVISLLRKQLAWRRMVSEPGFDNKVYYNNNPDSKWGQFHPLFSYDINGMPHGDSIYSSAWSRLLYSAQGMLKEAGEPNLKLARLLPRTVPFSDPDQAQKLYEYGSKQERVCEVFPKSDITPHSARVSLVSHGCHYLPADIIGRYWTGQTAATVHHYVKLDEDEMFVEQQRQNRMLLQLGYEKGYEATLSGTRDRTSPFIKADDINSNLSRSLRVNLEETISAYGCVSLSLNETSKTGLDVIRETRAIGAVSNKTEICPYGNSCPPDVVIQLNGFRRCGPCNFAVRSIDHLPAITAKIRQVLEGLMAVEKRLQSEEIISSLTSDELDTLGKNRGVLAEDLAAWQLAGEILETMRQRLSIGDSNKTWHIQKPEIIERDLKRVPFPTGTTEYVLARLVESEAFPILESREIKAQFDLLRRHLLVNVGNIRESLNMEQPSNPAAACLGLIRSIVAENKLTIDDLIQMLESDDTLGAIPPRKLRLLPSVSSQ